MRISFLSQLSAVLSFACLLLATPAVAEELAQSPIGGDRQPQPLPELSPLPEDSSPELAPAPANNEPEIPVQDTELRVTRIELIGGTLYNRADFATLIIPLEGRRVRFSEIQEVADAITERYQNEGYLTSRAFLPQQNVKGGVVDIQLLEGSLNDLTIEGRQRLRDGYLRSRLEQASSTPLNFNDLNDQLSLLGLNPLLDSIDATIEAGSAPGVSNLTMTVDEASPWFGSVNFNNYSTPSIGSERGQVELGFQNLTGWGDRLSVAYGGTTSGGSNTWDINYLIPVNALDGSISARAVIDRNEITEDEFDDLDLEGETELYELTYRQPLFRNPREEFALSVGFSYRDGQTFAFGGNPTPFGIGPDADGVSRTSVVRFGQDYLKRDRLGAWFAKSQLNFGTGFLDATENPDPLPDGQFFSWLGQAQRLQQLNRNNLLIVQADVQFSPDSLLPSEQFAIGGGQSIRGYRENARTGDNGFRFSVEDRITLARGGNARSIFQLAPFIEVGRTWNNPDNPNVQPEDSTLASGGLGAIWNPVDGMEVRLDYGIPILSIDEGDNLQDDGLHFSLGYRF